MRYKDSGRIKALMAYSYGALAEWEQAVATYRSILTIWSTPEFSLGLAEAELRSGNVDEARKIVATVEVSNPNPKYELALSLEYLNRELAQFAASKRA